MHFPSRHNRGCVIVTEYRVHCVRLCTSWHATNVETRVHIRDTANSTCMDYAIPPFVVLCFSYPPAIESKVVTPQFHTFLFFLLQSWHECRICGCKTRLTHQCLYIERTISYNIQYRYTYICNKRNKILQTPSDVMNVPPNFAKIKDQ